MYRTTTVVDYIQVVFNIAHIDAAGAIIDSDGTSHSPNLDIAGAIFDFDITCYVGNPDRPGSVVDNDIGRSGNIDRPRAVVNFNVALHIAYDYGT